MEEMECEYCCKDFKEGKPIYIYETCHTEFYFCSKECFQEWAAEDLSKDIYHREDFEDWLD
jgi:ribosomal protein L24E